MQEISGLFFVYGSRKFAKSVRKACFLLLLDSSYFFISYTEML